MSMIYALYPVVDPQAVRERFRHKDHLHDKGFASLLLALAAIPQLLPEGRAGSIEGCDAFIDKSISLHNTAELGLKPSLDSISTSMLLSTGLRVRKGYNASYLRIKEAVALAELLNLSRLNAYDTYSPVEKELAVRMFWLLAANERCVDRH